MTDKSYQPTIAGLRAFVAVAEKQHFGSAAATLGVSQSTLSQALSALETGLARLRTQNRVAVLHYSPIEATVVGEPEAIYPWLGTSRLEEPIDRFEVAAVVHGHAHHGSLEGHTRGGAAVYNVSRPLLQQNGHPRGFRVIEIGSAAAG